LSVTLWVSTKIKLHVLCVACCIMKHAKCLCTLSVYCLKTMWPLNVKINKLFNMISQFLVLSKKFKKHNICKFLIIFNCTILKVCRIVHMIIGTTHYSLYLNLYRYN
jgi:hypothetical protein